MNQIWAFAHSVVTISMRGFGQASPDQAGKAAGTRDFCQKRAAIEFLRAGAWAVFKLVAWHYRLTLAAVAGGGIALSAILAVRFSNTQVEERRQQLTVEATGFASDLEQYLQSRAMIAKTVGAVFEALIYLRLARFVRPATRFSLSCRKLGSWLGFRRLIPRASMKSSMRLPQPDDRRSYRAEFCNARCYRYFRRALYPVMDVEPKAADNQVGLGMNSGFPRYARLPSKNRHAMNGA